MALVTCIPLGHAVVQLNAVLHLNAPLTSFNISNLCLDALSRESNMNLCAFTIAAGPTYVSAVQNTGQLVVHAAQRMHFVVSSKRSRSSGDWSLSRSPGSSSLIRYGITF